MNKVITIAIDGTSGVGKSTVADIISKKLNILHLNSGALYRAVGLYALDNNIDPSDKQKIEADVSKIDIDVKYIDGVQRTYLCGEDVTDKLFSSTMSKYSSIVSQYPLVREHITSIQRKIAKKNSIIIEGRDITSVVLPDANFKFFLSASPEVRARRRLLDLETKGEKVNFDEVLSAIIERDRLDCERKISPLVKVPDAIEINTERSDAEGIAEQMIKIILGE